MRFIGRKEKLIRNLKPGDVIEVTNSAVYPSTTHRVTITRVQEGRLSMFGKRTWQAFFTPHLNFGSWTCIYGESKDKIKVYGK